MCECRHHGWNANSRHMPVCIYVCRSAPAVHLQSCNVNTFVCLFRFVYVRTFPPGAAVVLEDAFALSVHQLTRLRTLALSNSMAAVVADALPASLQSLTALLWDAGMQQPVVVSMAQAVSLQQLKLSVLGTLGAASQLPPNVTQLVLDGGGLEAVSGLQQLRQVSFDRSGMVVSDWRSKGCSQMFAVVDSVKT